MRQDNLCQMYHAGIYPKINIAALPIFVREKPDPVHLVNSVIKVNLFS